MNDTWKPIIYPADFKARVTEVFSGSPDIVAALETGSVGVGQYLDDSRHGLFSNKLVVDLIESGQTDALLAMAKKGLTIEDLYGEWTRIYDSHTDTLNRPAAGTVDVPSKAPQLG